MVGALKCRIFDPPLLNAVTVIDNASTNQHIFSFQRPRRLSYGVIERYRQRHPHGDDDVIFEEGVDNQSQTTTEDEHNQSRRPIYRPFRDRKFSY